MKKTCLTRFKSMSPVISFSFRKLCKATMNPSSHSWPSHQDGRATHLPNMNWSGYNNQIFVFVPDGENTRGLLKHVYCMLLYTNR